MNPQQPPHQAPGQPFQAQPAPPRPGAPPGAAFPPQQQQQFGQQRPMQQMPPQQQGARPPPNPAMQPRPQPGMPMARPPSAPSTSMAGVRPPAGRPFPQQPGMPPAGGVPAAGPQNPGLQPNAAAMQGRLSPRPPGQPAGTAGVESQMAGLDLQGRQPSPAPGSAADAGPAKTKRSARAYHTDAQQAPSAGWNDAPGQPNPPPAPWQQAAASRVAQQGHHFNDADADAALDQMPGQRNVVSPAQAAHNRAMMAQNSGRPNFPQNQQSNIPGMQAALSAGGGIAQPPHQAGQRFAGPRSKIDPDQIPSPVEMQDADQDFFDKEWFATCGRGGMPLSTTSFAAVDQGNCSPRHMRLTTYSMPATDELATTSQLPLAVLLQPFAQLRIDEAPIPVATFGESGPPRCKRCRAYINPWCVFVEGGQKWTCNLCGTATEVAADYFCNLDMSGRRVDFDQRPELSRGSIDFAVPKEYWAVQSAPPASVLLPVAPASTRTETAKLDPKSDANKDFEGTTLGLSGQGAQAAKTATKAASEAFSGLQIGKGRTTVRAPRPLTYLFAIDVSYSAVRSGALASSVEAIRETLYGPKTAADAEGTNGAPDADATAGPGFGLVEGARVAILTFDRALHFYNLSAELDQAQMLVVGDIDEPFVPISDGLLADAWESRHLIEGLLDNLPSMFADSMVGDAALGAARSRSTGCALDHRRTGQHLPVDDSNCRTRRSQAPRGHQAVRHRQGAQPVCAPGWLLPRRGGRVRGCGHRHQRLLLPFAVHRRGDHRRAAGLHGRRGLLPPALRPGARRRQAAERGASHGAARDGIQRDDASALFQRAARRRPFRQLFPAQRHGSRGGHHGRRQVRGGTGQARWQAGREARGTLPVRRALHDGRRREAGAMPQHRRSRDVAAGQRLPLRRHGQHGGVLCQGGGVAGTCQAAQGGATLPDGQVRQDPAGVPPQLCVVDESGPADPAGELQALPAVCACHQQDQVHQGRQRHVGRARVLHALLPRPGRVGDHVDAVSAHDRAAHHVRS
ncbi:hypothetical protein L1887_60214 [Cichorium endivia]|nr:hypothetical protein L1887_60214 [Cichorium endivia]